MGKKSKKKLEQRLKRCTPSSIRETNIDTPADETERDPGYLSNVDRMSHTEPFINTRCEVSQREVIACTEPIFFMNNSICNVPSPISIPSKLYTESIKNAALVAEHTNERIPDMTSYYAKNNILTLMVDETINSVVNLIIGCMNECIDHVAWTNVFFHSMTAETIYEMMSRVLQYDDLIKDMSTFIHRQGLIPCNLINLLDEKSPYLLRIQFAMPVTTFATELFANRANMFANIFSEKAYISIDELEPVRRLKSLNSFAGNGRNEVFAIVSAMMTNYTWSFSGIVETEIHRICCNMLMNYGKVSSALNRISEETETE